MQIMRRLLLILSLIVVLVFASAAFAQQGPGQGKRSGKIIFGTIQDIDYAGGTVTIVPEKYMIRGVGEVEAEEDTLEIVVGDRTRFGLNGERATLDDFTKGLEVVIISLEKDDTLYAIAMSDPETVKLIRQRMRGAGRGDRGGPGMKQGRPGGRGGQGMRPGGPGMDRRHGRGFPVYGEVTAVDNGFVTVELMPFPKDELGIPADDGKPRPGMEAREKKMAERFPDGVRIELTDKTMVMVQGDQAETSEVGVGDVFMFKCRPPEGDWSRENLPDYFVAVHVVDLETIKMHIEEGRNRPGGGPRGV